MAETLVLVVPVLAVLAAIFLARAAVQRGGVAVALCWWLLAALVVPIASIIIAALIIDAVNDRADGFVFFTLFFSRLLVVVNAFLYWFAYAIFQAKQTEKSRSIARRQEDWSADILKKLPHGAASTQLWGGFEFQSETIRVVEAGYEVGATVFPTIYGAVARIEKKE